MSAVTKPQRQHLAMMKHRLRCMLGRCCCAWVYDYQEWPGELVILTDADWASDSERRRSVDCVHIYLSRSSMLLYVELLRVFSSGRHSRNSASHYNFGCYQILQRDVP